MANSFKTPPSPDVIAAQKSNFLATISHELRTPMQSVYGLLELIQQQNKDAVINDMINAAQNSAGLMLDLLDDILDFARLDADRLELEQLEIPLRTLVQGVVEALQVKVGDRPIKMNAVINDDVPTIIVGDPKRLRQVLFNLVANALKFTEKGSVTVAAERQIINGTDQLRLSITDTGLGIAPETQDKLFQPFTQADNSTARKFGGTGLGLSICRKLVQLMGGEIGVSSDLGHGSTFWFTFPCIEADQNSVLNNIDLSGLRLLVVEDHPQAASEIEHFIKQMHGSVVVTHDILHARQAFDEHRFDVAIIDYALPDGNGIDLMREISRQHPHLGQILYTVHQHDGLEQNVAALGATYLSKPASRQGLGLTILDVAKHRWHHSDQVPQRVLIAEDTESIQDLLKRQMERLGIDATIVGNGMEAIKELSSNQYGLLIADLHMPIMDGYQLTHRVRATEPVDRRLPIILLTADIQIAQRSEYLQYGFDDCLIKPITFKHLRHALERWGIECQTPDIQPDNNPTHQNDMKTEITSPTISTPTLFDLAQLATNMGGTEKDAIIMLEAFPRLCAPLINRINHAIAIDDLDDLAEAAHSLKGAARSACCQSLGECAALIQMSIERRLPVENLIPEINLLFAAACDEIKRFPTS